MAEANQDAVLLRSFEQRMRVHDLTFDYSDDDRVRERGATELRQLHHLYAEMTPEGQAEARSAWNNWLAELWPEDASSRAQYVWHEPLDWQSILGDKAFLQDADISLDDDPVTADESATIVGQNHEADVSSESSLVTRTLAWVREHLARDRDQGRGY
jgi:hypothetical protein